LLGQGVLACAEDFPITAKPLHMTDAKIETLGEAVHAQAFVADAIIM